MIQGISELLRVGQGGGIARVNSGDLVVGFWDDGSENTDERRRGSIPRKYHRMLPYNNASVEVLIKILV